MVVKSYLTEYDEETGEWELVGGEVTDEDIEWMFDNSTQVDNEATDWDPGDSDDDDDDDDDEEEEEDDDDWDDWDVENEDDEEDDEEPLWGE